MPCILLLVFAFTVACTPKRDNGIVETRRATSLPFIASPELSAVDSLMWQRPDSALAVLMDYLDDDGRDAARHVFTNETFDNHYAHLLLAELLYKNDYAQTNRAELRQAVETYLCDYYYVIYNPHQSAPSFS